MSDVAQRFSENLRRHLAESPYNQEQLSARAGGHRTLVPTLLKGEHVPQLDTAIKVAAALGVPLEALAEGIVWTPAEDTRGKFEIASD